MLHFFIIFLNGGLLRPADFYNWNRVKLRYCDGASFAGEGQNEVSKSTVNPLQHFPELLLMT